MSLSFKKFIEFVEFDGDVSDEQINEIFGLFKNNQKIDKLRKEREKLKGLSAEKKAELDQALKDFAAGRKTAVTDRVKGALKDVDWDEVLSPEDRKYNAKRDRMATEETSDIGAKFKQILKKLMPHDGMDISDVIVDSSGVEFTIKADFKEHHPSMVGFQKNIKPEFSRIGFEKDPFDGRYYQLDAAEPLTDEQIKSIKKALKSVNLDESKAINVKAFKVEVPKDTTDQQIYDFIEDQSVVTIEHFDRKGNVVYFYPHFEHDYDPHMTGAMQAAFNRFIKHK